MSGMRSTKQKKIRKPRGIKKSGYPSYDLCEHCYSYGCDPMSMSSKFYAKNRRRRKEGRCPACGGEECFCKSKLRRKYNER